MAGPPWSTSCARADSLQHDASRIGARSAFDGPTLIWVPPRIGSSPRSSPELCCHVTPAPDLAPDHFSTRSGTPPRERIRAQVRQWAAFRDQGVPLFAK